MSKLLLELDGGYGEGGGQILRTSLALSLITGRGFHLRNIRQGRRKPGLQPQHLASVHAAVAIGGAQVRGASRDSVDLVFEPGPVVGGIYRFPIGTAGATGLVLHTVYLPLAIKTDVTSRITLEGGTHVSTSPCFHFLDVTWRAYLEQLGVRVNLQMIRPAIFLAAFNGFGLLEPVLPEDYRQLQLFVRHRRDLVARASTLRCQIREYLHALLPGYAV